jgi:hypothetical protein
MTPREGKVAVLAAVEAHESERLTELEKWW